MAQKLFKSTMIVASMTMLSRVLGFVRDMVCAMVFGAGPAFDAFVIAFKIPNFMRRLFGEGAFSQAFVPVLSEYRIKRDPKEVQEFINRIAGTLGFSVLILVALIECIVPFVVITFAPGFIDDPVRYQYATHMLHITFPYIFLIAMVAFAGAALNTFNRFAVPAFTPVLLNVALIGVTWWWAPYTSNPIYVLAWGVLIGGVVQLLFQIPFLKKFKLLPVPKLGFKDPGVRRVMKLMVPALFGVSVAQLGLLVDNIFASFLRAGSISWLYYSDRLTYLPQGVIGVALATVVLPHLSRSHSAKNYKLYSETLDWALRLLLLVGVPAALGLFLLAGPLLSTLIQHRAFTAYDVVMTKRSLLAFSIGLPSFMLVKILASAFYSRLNIRTPVKVAALALLANIALNFILVGFLAHAGLALATSLASFVNAGLLLVLLLRRKVYQPGGGWLLLFIKIVLANVVMGLLVWWLAGNYRTWFNWGVWARVWHLAGIILAAVLCYAATLVILGIRKRHLRAPT